MCVYVCVCVVKEEWEVLRALWYEIVSDKWYPFIESDCTRIEEDHCKSGWRDKVLVLKYRIMYLCKGNVLV